ncbi:hypothetical protein [Microvirga tunisiensis]|uniref:Uncharacterized protein n=1 Tax=Microvirga tunisiensis TaxID=2108360 RepID=A0A5N7MBF4_9HYPH|nr:hypothetical protein [Microvirga tunisiensis]MPR05916.1 hypothetical protein [Microvirga tunisiensis]MPR24251.1 hypothetical protein [Microvirga tunisiensis]
MAVFQAFNAAGVGFNMSSTGSSGWAFIGADPSVTTDLVYDNGAVAGYDIYGSALVDYFTARYWSDGYTSSSMTCSMRMTATRSSPSKTSIFIRRSTSFRAMPGM